MSAVSTGVRTGAPTGAPTGTLTNTGTLMRFAARRDRIRGPIWVGALAVFVPYIMTAYTTVFADASQLQGILGMLASPAMALFTGPGYGLDTAAADADGTIQLIFAGVYWLYLLVLVALMNILMVTRHTRAEEQAGRAELIRADVTGRHAPLTAVLALAAVANTVLGGLIAVFLIAFESEVTSSLLIGASTTAFGLFFAAVAAVTAQVSAFSSSANGMAGAVLGASFVIRGIGDMMAPVGEHGTWLSWLSPIGWAQQTRAFYEPRWFPVLMLLGGAAVLVWLAFVLAGRRDVGAGLLTVRTGRTTAPSWLRSPLSLAWAIQRGQVIGWTVGLVLAGLMYGSFTQSMVDAFADLPDIFQSLMGGASGALDGYLTLTMTMFRITIAAYVVIGVGKVMSEEREGRLEPVLATPVRPSGWLGSQLAIIAVAAAVQLVVVGALAGVFAAAVDGNSGWIGEGVVSGAVGIPGLWIVLGIAAALYAISPRLLSFAWIVVVVAGVVEVFGDLLQLPDWAGELSVFAHTPKMPTEEFAGMPVLVQGLVVAVLLGLALWRFPRRDLPTA